MRSYLLVPLSMLAPLAAGCNSAGETSAQSLVAKCSIVIATASSSLAGATPDPSPGPGPGDGSGSGSGSGAPLPTLPTDCPVCRDADGNPLDPSHCVVHDDVCTVSSENPGASAVQVTQTLPVLQHASESPAIAYYGACDSSGAKCENRDFAYQLIGNELAVATFVQGVTTVYAIPIGATAVKTDKPIFPLLPAGAGYANPNVRVLFLNLAGALIEGFGDIQNDCRVVDEDGTGGGGGPSTFTEGDPPPCWCTQC